MDLPTVTHSSGDEPKRRKSPREVFESLPVTAKFRVTAIAAITATLLVVQLLGAVWDTRLARDDALELARNRTASMAARLEAAGGGALDDLTGHRELLASTFRLDSGEVLQRYVREDLQGPGAVPPSAVAWTSRPEGILHGLKGYLALEPIYVESPVALGPGLSGAVSIVVDHRWIWRHGGRSLLQVPLALLLGGVVAWLSAELLRRQVAEPLAQLVRATRARRPARATGAREPGRRNEMAEIAANFDVLAERVAQFEREIVTIRHAANRSVVERTRAAESRVHEVEALMRSKDEFLANMSHEIRTPMNGVLGMAELLAGTELDKRQRRFVDSMRAAAETMMRIINDILDDSKIEAGKMDLAREVFDIRELAEQVGQLYAGRAESKKLEMICRIEPTVPSLIVGDPLRLRQVLGNLLANAVKYTDQGEVEIRVGLDDIRDGQCRVHFSVRDTGPGIAEADQSGVFEAYTQVGGTSRLGGTGLGLSIASRLVRLMGGEKIELRSELGRGSNFSFVLPFEVRETARVPDRASDEFSGLRVLVVDDNPTSFLLLEEMIANWSAEVTVLNHARQIGDRMRDVAARGKPFDVVLLDHSLPDATTDELLRTIRLEPSIAGTYVVLLSALDFNPSYEGSRAIAPDVCIGKPVRQQLLRNALQASREPRTEAPATTPRTEERPAAQERERELRHDLGLDVMVVDDNPINREVAVAMLEDIGCRVAVAEDGRAAVVSARGRRFDVILMDCQMPGMDGYAATEAIRRGEKQAGHPPTPIIALTANVLARDREQCIAAGMNGFVGKPFRAAQLLETLQPIADARSKRRAAGPAKAPPPAPPKAADAPPAAARPAQEPPALSDSQAQAVLENTGTGTTPTLRLPVLDLEQVQAVRGLGKPMVFERLCEMLFASAKGSFEQLDAALAEGDLEKVADAAHAFKSPVSNLGGRRLANLLERCETAAREGGDLTVVRRATTALKPHYAALVAALEAETRRGTGTG